MESRIKDDILTNLVKLPQILFYFKITEWIAKIVLILLIVQALVFGVCLIFEDNFLEIIHKYGIFLLAPQIAIVVYIMIFNKLPECWELYDIEMPTFWPLRSMGENCFRKIQKYAGIAYFAAVLVFVAMLIIGLSVLPWFGNEADIFYNFKVAKQYLGKWTNAYLILFYCCLYHALLTILCTCYSAMYAIIHLCLQCFLLNCKLENLMKDSIDLDPTEAIRNEEYQNRVTRELIICLKQHYTILKFKKKVNDIMYYPAFGFYLIEVVVMVCSVLSAGDMNLFIRIIGVAVVATVITIIFCSLGQFLENASEEIFYSISSTPWYLWNTKNRKIFQLFLSTAQTPLVLSCSDIIVVNNELLIKLYQMGYSILTFLMNAF